jgi:hypothetical protein
MLGEEIVDRLGDQSGLWHNIIKTKFDSNSAFGPFNLQMWHVLSCGLNSWHVLAWAVTVFTLLMWMLSSGSRRL